ncbi:uncharacterized protein PHACADRAFT_30107 [Phanerochaete carnosa HHB-10118-sp]|uniref:F-box domain-containing protein n=1 Tax=Phanerochaete carnosa (strain HHB-10118-sp) TaxID=650164 RepID=K5W1K3_PHACS|nr:uncharacterized protein PHACADRAFT_30107 [Phanerochaete carnosa HHB-10118-sp]EKM52990.1 hypothetical protein PHACADRAFT_30107 [Phanerochaete carnosa HHB-10118-sp]
MPCETLSRRLATVVPDDQRPEIAFDSEERGGEKIPPIPLEIIDDIVNYLHPDNQSAVQSTGAGWRTLCADASQGQDQLKPVQRKHALLACSAVCRAWNSVVRPHLFRDVTFVVRAPHRKKGQEAYKTFADYDHFLRSSPAAAAAAVHKLRLGFPNRYKFGATSGQQLHLHALSLFLSHMPALETLHLRNVQFARLSTPLTGTTAGPFMRFSLKELQIEYNEDDMPSPNTAVMDDTEAVMLSGIFAKAETLHLTGLSVRRDDPPLFLGDPGPEKLVVERLVVQHAYSGPELFSALRSAGSLDRLRSLEVRMVAELDEEQDMLKKVAFAALVAPSLEHLTVTLHRHETACGRNVLDITSFTSLRTVSLGFTVPKHPIRYQHVLRHVLRSFPLPQLSREQHPHLEELRLCINFDLSGFVFAGLPEASERRRQLAPRENLSLVSEQQKSLDEIDQRLVDTVERCGLRGVIVEYEARSDVDVRPLIHETFPRLRQLSLLDLRVR